MAFGYSVLGVNHGLCMTAGVVKVYSAYTACYPGDKACLRRAKFKSGSV
eukprot:gene15146-23868_t